jgi:hypothetical protein
MAGDLQPGYLESSGFAARGLLSAPEAADSSSCAMAEAEAEAEQISPPAADNLMVMISGRVADGIENLGLAVARYGCRVLL